MSQDNSTNDPMNFVKSMWENMGFSLPGMVTPTFDVEEIEKRVKDMKAVEGWLKTNLSMLQMTIQSLEMQCSTIHAVRTMSQMTSGQPATAEDPAATAADPSAQPQMWPWNLMQQIQEQMQKPVPKQPEVAEKKVEEEAPKSASKRRKKPQ